MKVCYVKNDWEADIKVHKVSNEWEADVKVHIVRSFLILDKV